jgi:uroporphyrinogen-III synthase
VSTVSRPGVLAGATVVVTRTRSQASELVAGLAARGAGVVELPVIAIEDPADGGTALVAAADRLVAGHYRWVALTSVNAVSRLLAVLDGRPVPPGVRWAAVGAGTARALAGGGFPPDLVPEEAVSDSLAERFPPAPDTDPGVNPATVLFPRAEVVRGALVDGLEAKGWSVDQVVAYRTVSGTPDPGAVEAAARAGAIAFTSSSTVERTIDLLGVDRIPPAVVTIGPVTSAAARRAGLVVAAEAEPHTIAGLVDAVVAALAAGAAGAAGAGTVLP